MHSRTGDCIATWDIRWALSWWVDQKAKVDKLFNRCATSWPRTVIVDGTSSLLPKAWTFVFCQYSSSQRDAASGLVPSSQVQAQGVQVTRQEELHRRWSPDLKMSVVQKTLRSSLCQQFFPPTSPHQWQKSQVPIHILGDKKLKARELTRLKCFLNFTECPRVLRLHTVK